MRGSRGSHVSGSSSAKHGRDSARRGLLVELELARDAAADPDPSFALAKLDEVYRLRDEFQAEAIAVMHRLPDGSSAST